QRPASAFAKRGSIQKPESPEEKIEAKQKQPPFIPTLGRIVRLNASEWPYILLGCLGALVDGSVRPCFAIVFADMLGIFSLQLDVQTRLANTNALFFL